MVAPPRSGDSNNTGAGGRQGSSHLFQSHSLRMRDESEGCECGEGEIYYFKCRPYRLSTTKSQMLSFPHSML